MKLLIIALTVVIFGEAHSLSSITSPRVNFLEEAKSKNFNQNELEILKPIIEFLQLEYNKLSASVDLSRNIKSANIIDSHSFLQLSDLLRTIQPELPSEDESSYYYNVSLPNINNLKGLYSKGLSADEENDIQDIFQENIDDARETIQILIELSNETEAGLITINKIKIIKFIYRMIQKVYGLGIQGGRTAYCTYSSYPAINSTLKEGSQDIGSCYNYTETSIGRLRRDVKTAITDIRANVKELVGIYKKFAKRHSLLGKLLTVFLNIQKISKDIKETKSIALATIEEVKNDGPIIAANIKQCATTSIPEFINNLNQTITDLITCINFVDDSTQGPEPEPESVEESFEI
ncbi:uncharacterized protein LOC129916547 [Episyrphus balteatus]|uniref:uncharacterized protein LOC129916547 n=1 Tax=Episyrphus balteatus TaxID=286459 RepID=UPI0024850E44|nr:uncharacterized protein LOC129916547 [Episyrphus balteatus]